MEITIKRDGLTLHGEIMKPEAEKCPAAIIFHGLMSTHKADMFCKIAEELVKKGIAVVKFDFNGHGESDGEFFDMNVYSELLDAAKIMDYVRKQPWVTEIYLLGHSQGGLVGSMIAGYYREIVKKLVLLAPAATIKDDAVSGNCFGTKSYDPYNVPESILLTDLEGRHYDLSNTYVRFARTLPIYETASMFEGKTLIIHGSVDPAVGVIGSKRYAECMKDVDLEIIEGEEHGLNKFSMEHVVERVTEFLSA